MVLLYMRSERILPDKPRSQTNDPDEALLSDREPLRPRRTGLSGFFLHFLSLTLAFLCLSLLLGGAPGAETGSKSVYVIPVNGDVEPAMAAYIERAVLEAGTDTESIIVLEIDTFGGRVDSALEMVDALINVKNAKTIAFVTEKAISAGALISLACNKLVMKNNTTIGDCAPITYSNEGPKMMGEKFQSPLRAKFRTLARRNGYPAVLAEAMVTADMEVYRVKLDGKLVFMDAQEYQDLGKDRQDSITFKKTVVAVSGGIDSALVLALAVDALGKDRVAAITMPSQYSSDETLSDAEEIAANFGVEFHTVPIFPIFGKFTDELSKVWNPEPGLAEENLQARIRGTLIMAMSNKNGWLVLTTGNKSEIAVGYCTLYGDMAGGFAVIKDVPKTLVFDLCRWRNEQGMAIPPSTIERPPSAELRPDQQDTDSLPPYEVLDPILEAYVEKDMGIDAMLASGFNEAAVLKAVRLVDLSEYKRRQGPPGIKITPKAFGRDRRMPITNRYRG